MKIISWNICVTNKRYPEIINYLGKQDADIISLQEVIEDALSQLKKVKGYFIYSERIADGKDKERNTYRVILSRYKIKSEKTFLTLEKEANTHWKRTLKMLFGLKRIYHIGIYIDTEKYRIINLHLDSYVSPKARLSEFSTALNHVDMKKPTIICGDFNSYGVWYLNIVPLVFMGMNVKDFFFNEKKELKKLFEKHNLNDVFRENTVNFLKIIRLHTDYILLPSGQKVKSKLVDKNTIGSDHNMISVEI